MADSQKIAALAERLTEAKTAYYNSTPIMDDAAYDALEAQLRLLDPNHPVLLKIGAPATSNGPWKKVRHSIPMSSLNKAQTFKELADWHISCGKHTPLVVMSKLDGFSLSLYYEDRCLKQALTRGDGLEGEDITRNVRLMKGVVKILPPNLPDGIPTPNKVYIRAEGVVLKSDHNTYFKGDSNPRATANGTAKRQSDNSKCAHLTVITYQFLPNGQALSSKQKELETLTKMGFNTPLYQLCKTLDEVEAVYQTYIKSIRVSLDVEIDGLVIDIDNQIIRENLGDLNNRPKGSIAYKFPHEKQPTTLINIEWQIGNSGRITPVAIFAPVMLGGKSIERASLAGVRQVEHLKLFPNCNILVSLRNDVIPRVEANLDLNIENDL